MIEENNKLIAEVAQKFNIPESDIGIIDGKPVVINTIVRSNLMDDKNYSPYCGNNIARRDIGGCDNPRTNWNGSQFVCPRCRWTSQFPQYFIDAYKAKHNL